MAETFDKNMIDKDEYPATAAIEQRCVAWLPTCSTPKGCATTTRQARQGFHDRLQ